LASPLLRLHSQAAPPLPTSPKQTPQAENDSTTAAIAQTITPQTSGIAARTMSAGELKPPEFPQLADDNVAALLCSLNSGDANAPGPLTPPPPQIAPRTIATNSPGPLESTASGARGRWKRLSTRGLFYHDLRELNPWLWTFSAVAKHVPCSPEEMLSVDDRVNNGGVVSLLYNTTEGKLFVLVLNDAVRLGRPHSTP